MGTENVDFTIDITKTTCTKEINRHKNNNIDSTRTASRDSRSKIVFPKNYFIDLCYISDRPSAKKIKLTGFTGSTTLGYCRFEFY